jgi:hypothetical protein
MQRCGSFSRPPPFLLATKAFLIPRRDNRRSLQPARVEHQRAGIAREAEEEPYSAL